MQAFSENIVWGLGAGTFFTILYLYGLIDEGWSAERVGYFTLIGGALLVVFCFWFGFYALFRRFSKKYDEIRIYDSRVEILYDNGSIRSFNIGDIKKCRLKNVLFVGKIVFKDGTVLINTDRVSYFPVFRQKLLDRIEAYQAV